MSIKTHGESKTHFYSRWIQIVRRCRSKKHKDYPRYGGRGIKVIWKDYQSFKKDMYISFLKLSKKVGKSNAQIDRIDVNGNYCKENCRWSTPKEQGNNRRNNRFMIYKGMRKTIAQWADYMGVSRQTVRYRIERGLKPEQVIEIPISHANKHERFI